MKYYKEDGETYIDSGKPQDISLQDALEEVDNLPSDDEYVGNFIGFTNEKGETVQFIRREEDSWLIDVPVLENNKYAYMLQDTDLTTKKVRDIVEKFFSGEDWKPLCNLKR